MNEEFEKWWQNTWAENLPRGNQRTKDIANQAWDKVIDILKQSACQRHKRWREKNPDKWKAGMDNWHKNNKDRVKIYQHEYYLKKRRLKKREDH